MSEERAISFPPSPGLNEYHYEHGRTWKWVEPGMWQSVGGGQTGSGPNHELVWDDIAQKPTEFPPEDHTHDQYALGEDVDTEVERIDAEMLNLNGAIDAEAVTREADDDALALRVDALEAATIDNGNFIDAPNDGKLYGRQSEAWSEVVIPEASATDWGDVTNKPTEFPPSAHAHAISDVTGLQAELDGKMAVDVEINGGTY